MAEDVATSSPDQASDAALPPRPPGAVGRPASARVRNRLARLGGQRPGANPVLEPLLRTVRANHPKLDISIVERAYAVAEHFHEGQLRKSGDPYITHPLAVATILAELGMTGPTLAAALLHDTVEDTAYTVEGMRKDFGDEVAKLVDGVTKLDKVKYGDAAQSETVRKMVVAMAQDIRVLVIKLADRLHNARTWRYVSVESAQRKARETLEIYAPLAHRLGMNTIKWELEDLSFATLYPKVYDEIVRLVAERAPAREEYLAVVRDQVGGDLGAAKIKATVTGPAQALLLRLPEDDRPRPRLRGHLRPGRRAGAGRLGAGLLRRARCPARALEPGARPVQGLHRDAQVQHVPVAAHDGDRARGQAGRDPDPQPHHAPPGRVRRRRALEVQGGPVGRVDDRVAPAATPSRSTTWPGCASCSTGRRRPPTRGSSWSRCGSRSTRARSTSSHPRATSSRCPSGATPVDFAYAVHTEVGHHCIGGRVNGRLVPLESTLQNGDVVEILTSKAATAGPSRDWLMFVKSPRARNKIRQWFSKERREEAIEQGKDAIAKAMRKQGLPIQRLMSHESLTALAGELRYADVSALYAAVGDSHVSAQSVVSRLVQALGGEEGTTEDLAEATTPTRAPRRLRSGDPGVVVKGVDDLWVKLARCCTPVPGDPIIGFVTRANGVSVHRADCSNVAPLQAQPDRIVEVEWAPSAATVFLVQIQVEALDRSRLLSDVTRVLSDAHVNILSASVQTTRDRVALSRFTFEMGDPAHLDHVLAAVRRIDGVFDVYRITGGRAG